jgi:hypothetical protein
LECFKEYRFRFLLKQKTKSEETNYTVIVGDETPFDRSGKGKKLSGFGSESVDMVVVTEMRTSGCWMNPNVDVSFEDAKQGINGIPKRLEVNILVVAAMVYVPAT